MIHGRVVNGIGSAPKVEIIVGGINPNYDEFIKQIQFVFKDLLQQLLVQLNEKYIVKFIMEYCYFGEFLNERMDIVGCSTELILNVDDLNDFKRQNPDNKLKHSDFKRMSIFGNQRGY